MRILAVDPGEKRIGLAISDPTETIATPLSVIAHVARKLDAAAILQAARDNDAGLIVIGQSVDDDGQPTLAGRRCGPDGRGAPGTDRSSDHILG